MLIDILKQKTGKEDIDVGKMWPTLFIVFGNDSSPKVKKFMKVILNKLKHGEGTGDGGEFGSRIFPAELEADDEDYLKPALEINIHSKQEVYAGEKKRSLSDSWK